jgi:predicted nucleotidyltransferase
VEARIAQIVQRLRSYDPEPVVLFGSAARGGGDDWSDVDLVIIQRTRRRFLDRLKEVIALLKPDYALDVLVYTPAEFRRMKPEADPFIEQALKDGVVLCEKPAGRSKAAA